MEPSESTRRIKLTPDNNKRLARLYGQFDENLHLIERYLGVEINNPSNDFEIIRIPNWHSQVCKQSGRSVEKSL